MGPSPLTEGNISTDSSPKLGFNTKFVRLVQTNQKEKKNVTFKEIHHKRHSQLIKDFNNPKNVNTFLTGLKFHFQSQSRCLSKK